MAINTEIYGDPETWGTSTLTGAGFKWVNFNETTGSLRLRLCSVVSE